MLLHAAYNTALGVAILRPDGELVGSTYVTLSLALTGTLWLVALGLTVATHGRLGLPETAEPDTRPASLPPQSRRTTGDGVDEQPLGYVATRVLESTSGTQPALPGTSSR
jgi:hypothetical protein